MTSDKALAIDISRRFGGNVTLVEETYSEREGLNFIELFKTGDSSGNRKITLVKNEINEGYCQAYDICFKDEGMEDMELSVYTHYVDFYLVGTDLTWYRFMRALVDRMEPYRTMLTEYRRRLMKLCNQVGSSMCIYFDDILDDVWNKSQEEDCTYEKLVEYIEQEEAFYFNPEDKEGYPYRFVDLPACLADDSGTIDEDNENIFIDDFRDLRAPHRPLR